MTEGTVIRWLKPAGTHVKEGESILEIETDKATAEVEAPASGVLDGVCAEEGKVVPVGDVMAYIVNEEGETPIVASSPSVPNEKTPQTSGESRVDVRPARIQAPDSIPADRSRVLISPAARRLAEESGIDLQGVSGSGPGGRITSEDVKEWISRKSNVAAQLESSTEEDVEWHELSAVRRVTAERMTSSAQTAPHFRLTMEANMSEIVNLRGALMEGILAKTGKKLSLTALMVKVAATTIKDHPLVNAEFRDGRIGIHHKININVAIGTDSGLVAPVITDAERKTVDEIVQELEALREKARSLRFTPGDLQGGTFTISNLGMFDVDEFSAILNPPQSAILAIGRIAQRPVCMLDGSIVGCPIARFTLSVDHRVLDGLTAAQFLKQFKDVLENASSLLPEFQ